MNRNTCPRCVPEMTYTSPIPPDMHWSSECPNKKIEMDPPLENRLWASNLTGARGTWSFDTFPTLKTPEQIEARAKMIDWSNDLLDECPGVLLFGPAGSGKTGLAVSAARHRIIAGDGGAYFWMVTAGEGVRQGVNNRELRKKPAPIWFEWWPTMVNRFSHAMRAGQPDSDEDPDYSLLFREFEERVSLLVLDDIDVGERSGFREMFMLSLLNTLEEGKRLIVTMNHAPADAISLLGDRIVDRLMSNRFLQIKLEGSSLRSR